MPGPFKLDTSLRNLMNITEQKWPMWFDNCAQNIPFIRQGKKIEDIPLRKGPAVIVGGGPSLNKYQHAAILGEYRGKIPTIITTDRPLKTLLVHDCTPDFVASIDGDPIVSQFYNLHSDERGAKIDCVFDAVTVHPLTVKNARENLKGDFYWFTHFLDDPTEERCPSCNRLSLTASYFYFTGHKTIIQAPGNVGAFAWHLAKFLGCSPIIMVGMDFGYPEGTPPEKTLYYDALLKEVVVAHLKVRMSDEEKIEFSKDPQKAQERIEVHAARCKYCYDYVRTQSLQTLTNPDFNNKYVTDRIFVGYRDMLMPFIEGSAPETITVNATGGGALHGQAIKSMTLEAAIREYC